MERDCPYRVGRKCGCEGKTVYEHNCAALDIVVPLKPDGATKHDSAKVDVSLLPIGPLMAVAAVWDFGKRKYASYNWTRGFAWSRPYAAALRHIFAWASGEDKDPESGLPHLAHAICCLSMLLEFQETKTGEDDRYVRGKKHE